MVLFEFISRIYVYCVYYIYTISFEYINAGRQNKLRIMKQFNLIEGH